MRRQCGPWSWRDALDLRETGCCMRELVVAPLLVAFAISARVGGAEVMLLTPEEGLRLAMKHNESLLMAQADQKMSVEKVREARAAAMPQLTASVDYTRNWLLPTFVFDDRIVKTGTDNSAVGTVRLTYPLYSGGGIRASLKAAHLNVAFSDEAERATRQAVIAQVEGAFYDFLLARELDQLSQLALTRARSNLKWVSDLRRTGRVAEYDLLRAQVEVTTVESDSIRVRNDLEIAELQLKDVVGLDLEQQVQIVAEFRETSELDLDDLSQLLRSSLSRRPESRQLGQLIARRQREVQVAKADGRPVVDLIAGGQAQFQSDDLDVSQGDEWRRSWSTGVRLQLPVFDGMRSGARTAHARIEVRRLELERERLERTIEREVREAWMNLHEASGRVEARRRTVEQATKGLQVGESRYWTGLGTQLEILDAQVVLAEAETALATARRDRARALVALERAVGVLGESPVKDR